MGIHQWPGKLQTHQVVTFGVLRAQSLGPQAARDLGQRRKGSQWSAWNLQRNLRGGRQRATNRQKHATGRDVQGRGKLQKLPLLSNLASDEDGNRQW